MNVCEYESNLMQLNASLVLCNVFGSSLLFRWIILNFLEVGVDDDKQGIREYASLLFADAAVVDVLLNNAGTVADGLLEKDPVWRELSGSQVELSEDRFHQAITRHFQQVVYRAPSDDEMSRYWKLFQDS